MQESIEQSLRVEALKKQMPGFVLEADFKIGASERIAVVGRSGLGKTTLLRLIAGLESKSLRDSGRIFLGRNEITDLPVQKREIGFVFKEQALFSGRSIFENVAFGLKVRNYSREKCASQVSDWLKKFGLADRAHESVDHLSGGERQRVAIARALITQPKLLLLDEPFVGLDPELRDSLCDELIRILNERPVPLLFVSHDERDARRLATGKLSLVEAKSAGGGTIRKITECP